MRREIRNEQALSEDVYMNVEMSVDHHHDVGLISEKGNMTCLLFFFFFPRFLYTLLSDLVVANHSLSFLILCNKQDQTMAKGCTVIRSLLEKEM